MIHYLDFDLAIEPLDLAQRRYRARVLDSPRGQATAEFVLPFTDVELENYILKMARLRRGMRGPSTEEGQAAVKFGSQLYRAVFQGEVGESLRRSLDLVHDQQGLRIRLYQGEPTALADLPWEYLYDPTFRRFFGHSVSTPVVRYLQLPQAIRPLTVQPPLNLLVLIAKPRGYTALDVESEWRNLEQALADLQRRGIVTLTRLERATLDALRRQLRRQPYHIFHFIGHGGFDPQTQEGVLYFEDEDGYARPVSGDQLGALFHDHPLLRLAVLNACEGARVNRSDPFSGVAQHLVLQGIPAVIAMQFEITDDAAKILAQEFYTLLADSHPVDAALGEARKAIFTAGNDIEWGTPVLYLRAPDGHIFDVAAPSVPAESVLRQPPVAQRGPVVTPQVARDAKKSRPSSWRQPGPILGVLALLLMLASLWQAPRLFNALFPGVGDVSPTATTEVALADQTPTPDATATLGVLVLNAEGTPLPTSTTTPTPTPEPAAGDLWKEPKTGIAFVYVPAGEFLMGSSDADPLAFGNEQPQQTVFVDAFWIMQTEVTNAQYRAFVEAGGYTEAQKDLWTGDGWQWRADNNRTQPGCWQDEQLNQPDHPVVCVSWYEAVAYASWLARETSLNIRLPSEAEWEKAARGTEGFIYPWGNEWDGSRLNYCDKNCEYYGKDSAVDDGYATTAPVGAYPAGASPYNALDMAGNVWEWTSSVFEDYRDQKGDGRENLEGTGRRVLQGGSFTTDARGVRCAARFGTSPGHWPRYYGLRLGVSPSTSGL